MGKAINLSELTYTLIERLPNGDVNRFKLTGQALSTRAKALANYTLIDDATQKPPKKLRLLRKGDALLLEQEGEYLVEIEAYYTEEAVTFTTDGSMSAATAAEGSVITASSPSLAASAPGEFLIWASKGVQDLGISTGLYTMAGAGLAGMTILTGVVGSTGGALAPVESPISDNGNGTGNPDGNTGGNPDGNTGGNPDENTGGNPDGEPTLSVQFDGILHDDYVAFADVFADMNGNGRWDEGEPKTTTQADGRFSLQVPGSNVTLIAVGGVDTGSGVPNNLVYRVHTAATQAGDGIDIVISPMSTVIASIADRLATQSGSAGMTADVLREAAKTLSTSLGLSLENSAMLLNFDAVAAATAPAATSLDIDLLSINRQISVVVGVAGALVNGADLGASNIGTRVAADALADRMLKSQTTGANVSLKNASDLKELLQASMDLSNERGVTKDLRASSEQDLVTLSEILGTFTTKLNAATTANPMSAEAISTIVTVNDLMVPLFQTSGTRAAAERGGDISLADDLMQFLQEVGTVNDVASFVEQKVALQASAVNKDFGNQENVAGYVGAYVPLGIQLPSVGLGDVVDELQLDLAELTLQQGTVELYRFDPLANAFVKLDYSANPASFSVSPLHAGYLYLKTDQPIVPPQGSAAGATIISLRAINHADANNDLTEFTGSLRVTVRQPPVIIEARITQVLNDAAGSSGEVAKGGGTNDATPKIIGVLSQALPAGEEGSYYTVDVYAGRTLLGQATIDSNDPTRWSFQTTDALPEGRNDLTVRVTFKDVNGETITLNWASSPLSITVDTIAPEAPRLSASNGDTVSGSAEPGAIVSLVAQDGQTVIGSVVASADGRWIYTPPARLADGAVLQAFATDKGGNKSPLTPPVVVDWAAPVQRVTLDAVLDDVAPVTGAVASPGFSNDRTLTLAGTLSAPLGAGEVLRVYADGPSGPVRMSGNASVTGLSWSFVSAELPDGTYRMFARVEIDAATGTKLGANSNERVVSVDTVAPTQLVAIDLVTDDLAPVTGAIPQGHHTNDATPTFRGTLSAPLASNEALVIYDTRNGVTNKLGTAQVRVVTVNGVDTVTWSFTPSVALPDGSHVFTAQVEDAAGNASLLPARYAFSIDTTTLDNVRISGAAPATAENSGYLIYAPEATTAAGGAANVIWSLGPDAAPELTIDPQTGQVRARHMPDHESRPSYTFTVIAYDGANAPTAKTVTVNVTDVVEAPGLMSVAPGVWSAVDSPAPGAITELEFIVRRSDTQGAAAIDWVISGIPASDFAPGVVPSGRATFANGEATALVKVAISGNLLLEAVRDAVLTILNPSSGYRVDTVNQAAAISVVESLAAEGGSVVFTIAAPGGTAFAEGAEGSVRSVAYTIKRSGDVSAEQSISYSVVPSGSALLSGDDFADAQGNALSALPSGPVTFAAGSDTATITLRIRGDNKVGPDESFNLVLGDLPAGARVFGTSFGTVINDDAYIGVAPVAVTGAGLGEVSHAFVITRSGAVADFAHTVYYTIAPIGEQGSSRFDTATRIAVNFAKGEVQKTVTVTTSADEVVAGLQTFGITLEADAGSNVTLLNSTAVSTILPNLQDIEISADIDRVLEGTAPGSAGEFVYTVTRSGNVDQAATITWRVSGGGGEFAASANDFAGGTLPGGTLQFAPGETTAQIRFKAAEDSVLDGEERFVLHLESNVPSVRVLTPTIEGFIVDDESAVGFSAANTVAMPEGDGGTSNLIATVSRIGFAGNASTVEWRVSPGTASLADFAPGQDLLGDNHGFPSGTLSLLPGEASGAIKIRLVADSVLEADETFTITLANPSAGTKLLGVDAMLAGYGNATNATIINDDAIISLASSTFSFVEGNGGTTAMMALTVKREGSTVGSDWVKWALTSTNEFGANNADLGQPNNALSAFTAYGNSWIDFANLSGSQSASGFINLPKSGYIMVAYNRDLEFNDSNGINIPFDQFVLKNLSVGAGATIRSLGSVTNSNFVADDVLVNATGAVIFNNQNGLALPGAAETGKRVVISSESSLGGLYFKVTGTDTAGNAIEELVRGPASGSVSTARHFSSVTSVETVAAKLAVGGLLSAVNYYQPHDPNLFMSQQEGSIFGGQFNPAGGINYSINTLRQGAHSNSNSVYLTVTSEADLSQASLLVTGGIALGYFDHGDGHYGQYFNQSWPSWQIHKNIDQPAKVRAEQISGMGQAGDESAVPNHFMVTGRDAAGNRISEIIAVPDFPVDGLAAMNAYVNGNMLASAITLNVPGRVIFSSDTTATGLSGEGRLLFTVKGTDAGGNAIQEVVAAPGTAGISAATSKNFATVTEITANQGFTWALNIGATLPVETTRAFAEVHGIAPVDANGAPLENNMMQGKGRIEFTMPKQFIIDGGQAGVVMSADMVNYIDSIEVISKLPPNLKVDIGFDVPSDSGASSNMLVSSLAANAVGASINNNPEYQDQINTLTGNPLAYQDANLGYAIFRVDAPAATAAEPVKLSFDIAQLGRYGIDTSRIGYAPEGTWSTDLASMQESGDNLLIPALVAGEGTVAASGQVALSSSGYIWIRYANTDAANEGADRAFIKNLHVDNGATLTVVGQKVIADGVTASQALGGAGQLNLNGSATSHVFKLPENFDGNLVVYVSANDASAHLQNGTYRAVGKNAAGETVVVNGSWGSTDYWGGWAGGFEDGQSLVLSGLKGLTSIESLRIGEYTEALKTVARWGGGASPYELYDPTLSFAVGNLGSLAKNLAIPLNFANWSYTYISSYDNPNLPGAPLQDSQQSWSGGMPSMTLSSRIALGAAEQVVVGTIDFGATAKRVVLTSLDALQGRNFTVVGLDDSGNTVQEIIHFAEGASLAYTTEKFRSVESITAEAGTATGYVSVGKGIDFVVEQGGPRVLLSMTWNIDEPSFIISGFDSAGNFQKVVVDDLRQAEQKVLGVFSEVLAIQGVSPYQNFNIAALPVPEGGYKEFVEIDLNQSVRNAGGLIDLGGEQRVVISGGAASRGQTYKVIGRDAQGNAIEEVIKGISAAGANGDDYSNDWPSSEHGATVYAVTERYFAQVEKILVTNWHIGNASELPIVSIGTIGKPVAPDQSLSHYGQEVMLGYPVATFGTASKLTFTSDDDLSDRVFTITGTLANGQTETDTVTGPNRGVVLSNKAFMTVTGIAVNEGASGAVKVGYATTQGGLTDNFVISGSGTAADPFVGHSTNTLEYASKYANAAARAGAYSEADVLLYVNFNGAPAGSVNLFYDLEVQGSPGKDTLYVEYSSNIVALLQGTAHFADGETETTILIPVAGDDTREANETMRLALLGSSAGTVVAANAAETLITIVNDDDAVTLLTTSGSATEGNGTNGYIDFTVTRLDAGPAKTVAWHIEGLDETDTSASADDFVSTQGSVTFAAGETTAVLRVTLKADRLYEANETFRVVLTTPLLGSGYSLAGNSSATGTIINDDVGISIAAGTPVTEGDAGTVAHTFVVTRVGDLSQASSLTWAVTGTAQEDAVAAAGADFAGGALASGTLVFAAGATGSQGSESQILTVNTTGNTVLVGDRVFTLALANAADDTSNITAGVTTGRIVEDDAVNINVLNLAQTEGTAAGGSTQFVYTLSRSGDISRELVLDWEVLLQGGSLLANEADFDNDGALPSGRVTFAAGAATTTLTIGVKADDLIERDEVFTLRFNSPFASVAAQEHVATILGDDLGFAVELSTTGFAEGNAGATDITITFVRVGNTGSAATYDWAVRGTSSANARAAEAGDFDGASSGSVSFAAGEVSKTVVLKVIGDSVYSLDKAFVIDMKDGAATLASSPVVTVANDDARLSLTVDKSSFIEGTVASEFELLTYTITREGNLDQETTVQWRVAGTDVDASDFFNPVDGLGDNGGRPSGVVTFAAGASSATVTVKVARDSNYESNETIRLSLSNPSAGSDINVAHADTLVINDDAQIRFSTSSLTFEVQEGDPVANAQSQYTTLAGTDSDFTNVQLTVERIGNTAIASTVKWRLVLDGTAQIGDFVGPTSGTVSFAAGSTASQTITFKVRNDFYAEDHESFKVELYDPSVGTSIDGQAAVANGTILDNDIGLMLAMNQQLRIVKPEGQEGITEYSWVIQRTGGDVDSDVTITWQIQHVSRENLPATDAADFDGPLSGTLTIPAGSTTGTITVRVKGDLDVESSETFRVAVTANSVVDDLKISGTSSLSFKNSGDPQYLLGVIARDEGRVSINSEQRSPTDTTWVGVNTAHPEGGADDLVVHYFKVYREFTTAGTVTVDWKVGLANANVIYTDAAPFLLHRGNIAATAADFSMPDALGTNGGLPSGTITIQDGEAYAMLAIITKGDGTAQDNKSFSVTLSNVEQGNSLNATIALGYIGNDDPLFSVGLVAPDANDAMTYGSKMLSEGQGEVTYRIYRTGDTRGSASVDWAVTFPNPVSGSTSATAHEYSASTADFDTTSHPLAGTVIFADGEAYKEITLKLNDDALVESWGEVFHITLSNPLWIGNDHPAKTLGISQLAGSMASIIIDNEAASSLVAVSAVNTDGTPGTMLEGTDASGVNNKTITYTLTRTGDTSVQSQIAWSLQVQSDDAGDVLTITGDTEAVRGYNYSVGLVTFEPGETSRQIVVTVRADIMIEPDERLIFTLIDARSMYDGYGVPGSNTNHLSGGYGSDGAIVSGIDYGILLAGSNLLWGSTPGNTPDSGSMLRDPNAYRHTTVIRNDDTRLSVLDAGTTGQTMFLETSEGDAGTKNLVLKIARQGRIDTDIVVNYEVIANGTAIDGKDVVVGTGVLELAMGVAATGNDSKTYTFNLPVILGDTDIDGDRNFTLRLVSQDASTTFDGAVFTANGTSELALDVRILNDDTHWSLDYVADDGGDPITRMQEMNSGDQLFTFVIRRSASADDYKGTATVAWSVAGTGAFPATAADFKDNQLPAGVVTFEPNEFSKVVNIYVKGDTLVERNETFAVQIDSVSHGQITGTPLDVTILNDDTGISISDAQIREGDNGTTALEFTVVRSGRLVDGSTMNWNLVNETANDADVSGARSGTITFAANAAAVNYDEQTQTITINIAGDTSAEDDETFQVNLSGFSLGISDLIRTSATGTILNDDTSFSITAGAHVIEGDAAGQSFTITRTHSTVQAQTVAWAVTSPGGSYGVAADDFVGGALPSGTVTFAPGELSKTIHVFSSADDTAEMNETFVVSISAGQGAENAQFATASAYGIVLNDDEGTVTAVTDSYLALAADASGVEGLSGTRNIEFEVTRSGNLAYDASVQWRVELTTNAQNNASLSDFGASLPSGTLQMLAGQSSFKIMVPVAGDGLLEGDETFRLVIENATPGVEITTAQRIGTILNDDAQVAIANAVAYASAVPVTEGTGANPTTLTFTIVRTGDTSIVSTVNWDVAHRTEDLNGTGDFVTTGGAAFPSGTVTFAAGESSKTVTVQIRADDVSEPDEVFRIRLTSPSEGTSLGAFNSFFKVVNDDQDRITMMPGATSQAEGDTDGASHRTFTFTLQRENPSTTATVDWTVAGNGARPLDASRFLSSSGTVTFEPGQTSVTFTVSVSTDDVGDHDRTFGITLSNPQTSDAMGAVLVNPTATLTVLNDDPVYAVQLQGSKSYAEGSGAIGALVEFKVKRFGDTSGAATLDWQVLPDGNHPANISDFGGYWPSGRVAFVDGEAEKLVQFRISPDANYELDEGFKVVIANLVSEVAGAVILDDTDRGVIANDDNGVFVSAPLARVLEGDSGSTDVEFVVAVKGVPNQTVTVHYVVEGAGAVPANAEDFASGFGAGSITLVVGADGTASGSVIVKVNGDTTAGADETFRMRVTSVENGTVAQGQALVTIENDDSLVALSVTPGFTAQKAEGNSGTTEYSFTVTRTGDLTRAAVVDYEVVGFGDNPVTASDFDGNVLPAGTVRFAAGEDSKTITFRVAGDSQFESHEDFLIRLLPGTATSGESIADIDPAARQLQGVVLNDDSANLVLNGLVTTVKEGTNTPGILTYEIIRNGDNSAELTVAYTLTADGSKLMPAAEDIVGGLSGTIVMAAGQSRAVLTIEVRPNAVIEDDRGFLLGISAPGFSDPASVSSTIVDDDKGISLMLIGDPRRAEGSDADEVTYTFRVNRAGNDLAATTLVWAITGIGLNPASANDFDSPMTGIVEFTGDDAAAPFKEFTVRVRADRIVENAEAFEVSLAYPETEANQSLTIQVGKVIAIIDNDDHATPGNDVIHGGAGGDVLHGLAGDDEIHGGRGADVIHGGDGNDTIHGGGGADVIYAGSGDDVIILNGDNLSHFIAADGAPRLYVDGGVGIDTLQLDGAGLVLDLTLVAADALRGIERIDLTGSGDNTLRLALEDVLARDPGVFPVDGSPVPQLLVTGNAGDAVELLDAADWVASDTLFSDKGVDYMVYNHSTSGAQLLVNTLLVQPLDPV